MSASSSVTTDAAVQRPQTIVRGVYLAVAGMVVGLPAPLLPGGDELPDGVLVIGGVLTVLIVVCAWGLWNLKRWGAISTFVVTALNVLTSLPGLFFAPSNWMRVVVIVVLAVSIPALVYIAHRDTRAALRASA